MAWFAADWNEAAWYGPEWHDAAVIVAEAPWFPADWHEADWFATDWHTTEAAPDTINDWFGLGWSGADWYAPQWFESVSGPTEFGFVEAGLSGTLTLSGFSGVYLTSFARQGSAASLGVSGRYAGFLPDPGGILDNDSDPDGEPLSYEIVTAPTAGTLTAYAGGAFTWDPGAAPAGRYSFTYRLWAGGEEADALGVVTIEYGNVFAEVTLAGYAGQLAGFASQGTRATLNATGFSGILESAWIEQGTAGTLGVTGYSGSVIQGETIRGVAGALTISGLAGSFSQQFLGQGETASLGVAAYSGSLDLADFLNAAGTAATLTVNGYPGNLAGFIAGGTSGTLTTSGLAGLLQAGLDGVQGTAGALTVAGFAPPPPRIAAVIDFSVSASFADFVVKADGFDWRVK